MGVNLLVVYQSVPVGPLIDYVAVHYGRHDTDLWNDDTCRWEPALDRIAMIVGVDRGTVSRWRSTGDVPFRTADTVACKALGVHPGQVWCDDWDQVPVNPYDMLSAHGRKRCRKHAQALGYSHGHPEFVDALNDYADWLLACHPD